ncbi:MAG TPA: AAA family ATPase [Polyangia bacterium]|nr:AAA family ATPase [Polyangia bacterium]
MSAPARSWPPAWGAALASGDVDGEALYLALEAASWPRDLPAAERRAFALLVLASCEARTEGATRVALQSGQSGTGGGLDARLTRLGAAEADRAAVAALAGRLADRLADYPALEPLVGRLGDHRPFIVDGGCLYQERDLRLEERLADALAARIATPVAGLADPAAALAAAAPQHRRWTAAQSAAIAAALARPLTVVTGGPGSGKTALIGGIVRAWRAAGMPAEAIAVAAPTGKAANRIAEGLAAEGLETPAPSTLHRLLGFSARRSLHGGAFRHHENHRLPHAGVIIDEASMVDLMLVEQLSRALRPDARLVLIGDADQLPAIQAGSVLRDLGPLALRLPESHRMSPDDPAGAEILEAARQLAAGKTPPARQAAAGVTGIEALSFVGFELCEPDARDSHGRRLLGAFVDRWYALHVHPTVAMMQPRRVLRVDRGALDEAGTALATALLERHRRARLLTVTRVGQAGAERINDLLVRRAAHELARDAAADALPPGTPVMMIENDYDRDLMNGDQGVALLVEQVGNDGPPTPMFAFPHQSTLALFPAATLRGAVAVSYATTVHKAQGSELVEAALILPEIDLPLLSRELVYTAVTRARRSIVVLGRRALLEQAAGRPLERSSGLAPRLAARGAFGPIDPSGAIDDR